MALVSMWPPGNGALNTITFDGRTYSSTPGNSISVQDFDVPIMQANGWTTYATVAGQNYLLMTSPASGRYNSISVFGRNYTTPTGSAINVPLFDAGILQANGWSQVYSITLKALTLSVNTFGNNFTTGQAVATIQNTSGGTITFGIGGNALSPANSLQISNNLLQVGPSPPAAPATITFGLVETLGNATNSPNQTNGFSVTETIGVPVNTAVPTISGTAQVAQTLTAANGTWTNTPTSFSYNWAYSGGGTVAGTNGGSTYIPVFGDIGQQIVVKVTATNAGGNSVPATSAPTSAVTSGGSNNTLDWSNTAESGILFWLKAA